MVIISDAWPPQSDWCVLQGCGASSSPAAQEAEKPTSTAIIVKPANDADPINPSSPQTAEREPSEPAVQITITAKLFVENEDIGETQLTLSQSAMIGSSLAEVTLWALGLSQEEHGRGQYRVRAHPRAMYIACIHGMQCYASAENTIQCPVSQ